MLIFFPSLTRHTHTNIPEHAERAEFHFDSVTITISGILFSYAWTKWMKIHW